MEARNVDTTPDPDPTSRHSSTLNKIKLHYYSCSKTHITENNSHTIFNPFLPY